jgi:hypothetical protein
MVAPGANINSVFSLSDNRHATERPETHSDSIATSFFGR